MKKVLAVIFSILLAVSLTSCSQAENQTEESLEISVTSVETDISEDTSNELSEFSETYQESSLISSQNDSDSKQFIDTIVDTEKLGEKTKSIVTNILASGTLYMNVTGKIALFGGLTSQFDVELAKNGENIMKKFTFGDRSVKILQNDNDTYTINDQDQTATRSNNAETIANISESDLSDTIAEQILSYISSHFGFDSLQYEKSGSEKYENKNSDFEEYTSNNYTIKIYFDGNDPQYIVSTDQNHQTSVIEIHALNTSPESNLFQIPENYQIISE